MENGKVTIDQNICVGCKHCVDSCKEVFGFDEKKNVAEVVKQPSDNCDCDIDGIINTCPVQAISRE